MTQQSGSRGEVDDPQERFRYLDPPLTPDQFVTSLDVSPVHDEGDDRWRETEWLLRTAPG